MKKPLLVIGNKNYSSWSLRGWLAMRKSGVDFDERKLPLDTPTFEAEIGPLSPSRRVPVLWDGDICIWDSLAIAEYANERWAGGKLLPADGPARALARCLCAEMHSAFADLRSDMPMNLRASGRKVPLTPGLEADIQRIVELWSDARTTHRSSGPWLLGEFSLADAMYAPVVFRFRTYEVEVPELVAEYMDNFQQDADMQDWIAEALEETEVVEADEAGM